MIRAERRAALLLAMVLLVGMVDVVVVAATGWQQPQVLEPLPAFDPELAQRITVGRTDAAVVLERRDDGWWLTSGATHRADERLIAQVLAILSRGVAPEARVEVVGRDGAEDLARYGLAGGQELRIDVEGEQRPLLTLYMGHDAGGGSSWVRWPGGRAVYRADLGGRATFDRSARAWRDRQVVSLDPAAVIEIRIEAAGRRLAQLTRNAQGAWLLDGVAVDSPYPARLAGALAGLRGLEVAAPAPMEPALTATLREPSGPPTVLQFAAQGEVWFVSRVPTEDRWRVRTELVELLLAAPGSLVP